MELSLFLAKLLGLYFLIVAALWVIHKDQVNRSIKDFIASRGALMLSGALNIVMGLAIVIGHNVWVMGWPVLITLLGYLLIVGGIMRFAHTDYVQKQALNVVNNGYWPMIGVLTVLGVILTYFGFIAQG